MQKSWKTTVAGILAALVLVAGQAQALLDDDPETVVNWNIVVGAIVTAVGLLMARDNNVTSEESGAKAAAAKRTAVG